jgi:DNA (cytosine-5)-methyltransferase 1
MRYISVCSGIEAATVAWHPLGWTPAVFSDIEAFPRALLRHHYPHVPLHGRDRCKGELFEDYAEAAGFQTMKGDEYGSAELLVGGTPCQDFSVSGLRAGLDGNRGNLTLEFSLLADRSRVRWLTWENVTGAFSTNNGRDFGAVLAAFSGRAGSVFEPPAGGWRNSGIVEPANEHSFGLAWRVLNARYFGVPQQRRRVFIVGYRGNWRRAAAALFERHGLQGYAAPFGEARESDSRTIEEGADDCLVEQVIPRIAGPLGAHAGDKGRGTDLDNTTYIATFQTRIARNGRGYSEDAIPALAGADAGATSDMRPCLAIMSVREDQRSGAVYEMPYVSALTSGGGGKSGQGYQALRIDADVRRLTPRESERVQGFPDDYTLIPYRGKPAADGPRYKALGNSMAVPVMRWLGERIAAVDAIA